MDKYAILNNSLAKQKCLYRLLPFLSFFWGSVQKVW